MTIPSHLERQLMQYLERGGWVKASALPNSPAIFARLVAKGWIEREPGPTGGVMYRITEKGTAAKRVRIP
jgi:DNA-binding PadR family transcriptional regulator